MFTQKLTYLTLNQKWGGSFVLIDPVSGTPLDITGVAATIVFRKDDCGTWDDDDWFDGPSGAITASTATGEIINGGASGTLVVNVGPLRPGVYIMRGETSLAGLATPFLNGQLSIGRNGTAQVAINPVGDSGIVWNDGGVLAFSGDIANLPTTLPSASGVLWNNGGVVSLS